MANLSTIARDAVDAIRSIDKIRVVLFVTWLWALAGLYVTKAFECMFRFVLMMPEAWLPRVKQTPANIKLLLAVAENQDITNKIKLFLRYYWDDTAGGFNFHKLEQLIGYSKIYFSFLLQEDLSEIDTDELCKNIHHWIVEQRESSVVQKTAGHDRERTLPFGTVSFKKTKKADNRDRLDFINQFEERKSV